MGGRFKLGYSMDIRTKDGKAIRGIRLTHEAAGFVGFELTSPNDRSTRIYTSNLGLHLFVILIKIYFPMLCF